MKYTIIKPRPWYKIWEEVTKVLTAKTFGEHVEDVYEIRAEKVHISREFAREFLKEIKQLPKTWDAYVQYCYDNHNKDWLYDNEYFRKPKDGSKMAEVFDARSKLMQLRDVYRDGWKPEWLDIFCIGFWCKWDGLWNPVYIHSLSFPTEELRYQFQENFKDLIEQTKPLFYS